MQPSNPLIISSGVASLSRKFLPCAPTRRAERGDGGLVRVWPGACVLHLRLAHLRQRELARSRLFRRAQTCGAKDFWGDTADHPLFSFHVVWSSQKESVVTPEDTRKDPTSRSAAARRSADAAARRHAWAGAAHPEPAPVPCGQPVVAARMLTADDR